MNFFKASEQLVVLAKAQQKELNDLMIKTFDTSISGLNETKNEVTDLQKRHKWYHSNAYQLQQLKSRIEDIQKKYDKMIAEILSYIHKQQQNSKEMLFKCLDDLKTTVNATEVRQYLNELVNAIDKVLASVPRIVLLQRIFDLVHITGIIGAMLLYFSGGLTASIATLGVGLIGAGTASEITFRIKLSELKTLLENSIESSQNKKHDQLNDLNSYFDKFVKRLRQSDIAELTEIVWFDENIHNAANQSFLQQLSREFASMTRPMVGFANKADAVTYVKSNIMRDIILITSGSTGEHVISEIGYYFNIKGIIIYCMLVDAHRTWAQKYKKVLLVSDDSDEVIEKIKQIKSDNIYFIINGFSLDDVKQKNINYYFSTDSQGFAIQNFKSIKCDLAHHLSIVKQLHNQIKSKNIYSNGLPEYFEMANLNEFAEEFVMALQQFQPEKSLITLYSKQQPDYYHIVNDLLNRFDVELLTIAGDYIKALRYALLIYKNTIKNTTSLKLYRGLNLTAGSSFKEFQRKFKIHDYIIFPAFLSTSLNEKIATDFAGVKGVLLEIVVDHAQINKLKDISADSCFKYESEVLLNCFQILKVTDISSINDNLLRYKCTLATSISN